LGIGVRFDIRRKMKILGSLIFLVIVVSVAGIWYLLQSGGNLAPDFSLIDLEEDTFRLSEFRGRVVVLDFMATWCGPCRLQMAHFRPVWEKYGSRIVLISIDVDPRESVEVLRAFAEQFPYATWIWARDTANLAEAYQVTAIPKTVIIDRNGYIRFTHTGVTEAATLMQEIGQLMS